MSIVPCKTSPLRGLFSSLDELESKIKGLEEQGAIDLTDYVTDAELASGLAGKSDTTHVHGEYATDAELASGLAGKSDVGHDHGPYKLVHYAIIDPSPSSQTISTQGVTINGLTHTWTVLAGSIVEIHAYIPILFSATSTYRNAGFLAELGGSQKVLGQYYVNNTTARVVPFHGWASFTGISTTVTAYVKASVISGQSFITGDDATWRRPRMVVKEYQTII